jgi:peptidoglycan/xylan/chitin deacetylase (PgdA/CDA1 family)
MHRLRKLLSWIYRVMASLLFIGFLSAAYAIWVNSSFALSAEAEEQSPQVSQLQDTYAHLKSGQRIANDADQAMNSSPTVYLTFDDGPSKLTPQVLDILQREGVSATFFELGIMAEQYPEYVQRVVKEGHALGNHSYNHVYAELYGTSFAPFWDQIQRTESIFERIAGVKPELVRAPGGTYTNFDAFYYYYLEQGGYTVVDWNIDSSDGSRVGVPAEEIIQTVKKGPLRQQLVVLMHDGTGHSESVKALPEVIRFFKEKGYAFSTLSAKVKPVQAGIGKSKWNRSAVTFDSFVRMEQKIQDYITSKQKLIDEAKENEEFQQMRARFAAVDVAYALAKRNAPPLTVQVNKRQWVVSPADYDLRNNQLTVPLRQLIDHIGGNIQWDAAQRKAVVGYGLRTVEFDLVNHTATAMGPGKQAVTYRLAAMELKHEVLYVPLRNIVEMLGQQVESYVLQPGSRVVSLSLDVGHLIHLSLRSESLSMLYLSNP